MNTTTNTRGVSEAMVLADAYAESAWNDAVDGVGIRSKQTDEARAALEAALSVPEPAAQGDGLCQRNPAPNAAPAVGVTSTQRIVYLSPEGTAPPAQPAERVPGAYVMDSGFKYESVGKHIPTVLVGFAPDDFDARDRFAAMLAASPAPSESESEGGKGVEA